jgi:hypothetical protein
MLPAIATAYEADLTPSFANTHTGKGRAARSGLFYDSPQRSTDVCSCPPPLSHLNLPSVNRLSFRRLTVLIALACAAHAAETKPAETKPTEPKQAEPKPAEATAETAKTPAADEPVGPTLYLPTVQVQEKRVKQIDNEINKVDKQIARERKNLKSTDLDKTLNSDQVAKVAAILGGNSASHMAAVAATRVSLLESERSLLERLKFPRTEEDKALIEKELVNLRNTRRSLDDATKQR